MNTSIIIRVKNEQENLKKLFKILKAQTEQDFEVIVVDNNSTDGSGRLVFDFFPKNRVQMVEIKDFTYPKACNLGAEKAKGKYLVYLSAHSFPVSKTWLEEGLSNFKDENVAGVFAFPVSGKGGSIWEKIISAPNYVIRGGHLGNTNSIIRKDLWKMHKFDESLITGSEDYEWSVYWTRKGFKVINDSRFRVYHSHSYGLSGIINQHRLWKEQVKKINKNF